MNVNTIGIRKWRYLFGQMFSNISRKAPMILTNGKQNTIYILFLHEINKINTVEPWKISMNSCVKWSHTLKPFRVLEWIFYMMTHYTFKVLDQHTSGFFSKLVMRPSTADLNIWSLGRLTNPRILRAAFRIKALASTSKPRNYKSKYIHEVAKFY